MKDGKKTIEPEDRTAGIIRKLLDIFREKTGEEFTELELLEMLADFLLTLSRQDQEAGAQDQGQGFRYRPQMFGLLQAFDEEPKQQKTQYLLQAFGELSEDEKRELIKQTYRRPQNFTMLPAKPVTIAFSGDERLYDEEGLEVKVATKKHEPITVYTQLSLPILEDGAPLQFPKVLSVFDKNVYFGVCSIFEEQQKRGVSKICMTDKQIFQAMTGTTSDPSKTALNKVRASMKRLRACLISLDFTKQAQLYGLENVSTYYHDFNMVYAEGAHIESGGKVIEGYVVLQEPILLKYAKMVKQIATIEQRFLTVPINNTDTNIALKNYLLEYISGLKNKKAGLSPVISFNAIYEHAGLAVSDLTKTERNRLKKAVLACLDYWREAAPGEPEAEHTGFIQGFSEVTLAGRKAGVSITV